MLILVMGHDGDYDEIAREIAVHEAHTEIINIADLAAEFIGSLFAAELRNAALDEVMVRMRHLDKDVWIRAAVERAAELLGEIRIKPTEAAVHIGRTDVVVITGGHLRPSDARYVEDIGGIVWATPAAVLSDDDDQLSKARRLQTGEVREALRQ
jgi:hypothetical protein